MSTYQHIAQRTGQVPVRQLCQVLQVAPSAYYAWHRQRKRAVPEPAWQAAVREAFAHHSQRYGTRRLRAEVQAQGHAVGRWRIRRVLKAYGLRAQQPRSFVPRTTESNLAVRAARNRLLGQPAPIAPNRVWVGDITYLPRQGRGWLYLAVWLEPVRNPTGCHYASSPCVLSLRFESVTSTSTCPITARSWPGHPKYK